MATGSIRPLLHELSHNLFQIIVLAKLEGFSNKRSRRKHKEIAILDISIYLFNHGILEYSIIMAKFEFRN